MYQNKTIKYPQSSTGKTCSPLLCYRFVSTTLAAQIHSGNAIANSQGLLHAETGFSYFGARYYDSDILTAWLSVDPMADSIPYASPYTYCLDNPIKLKDPNGEIPLETIWDIGNVLYDFGAAITNHIKGDHEAAKSNWCDLALDAAATLTPYVPAGSSKIAKVAKNKTPKNDIKVVVKNKTPTIQSKTLWYSKDKSRIDIEIPDPENGRLGGNHYQCGKSKYHYNPETNQFDNAPSQINKRLKKDKNMQKAINNGLKYLGYENN